MSVTSQQLRAYVDYLREMGVYDLYRREHPQVLLSDELRVQMSAEAQATPGAPAPNKSQTRTIAQPPSGLVQSSRTFARSPLEADAARRIPPPEPGRYFDIEPQPELPASLVSAMPVPVSFDQLAPLPVETIAPAQRAKALEAVRAEIGDCTRCPLAYAGRHNIVFADGDANAELMFVGEGPGADEDASGLPFVGKAGQLLNNMIGAMGLTREQVYIANIVKCRPPSNRVPEPVEANTCSQFLLRQIDIVRPRVIVALGSTAATYLLGVKQSLTSLRGQWHSTRGAKLIVTYHPAYLLRDPRQKGEAWKDLQMAMAELGLKPANKVS